MEDGPEDVEMEDVEMEDGEDHGHGQAPPPAQPIVHNLDFSDVLDVEDDAPAPPQQARDLDFAEALDFDDENPDPVWAGAPLPKAAPAKAAVWTVGVKLGARFFWEPSHGAFFRFRRPRPGKF